MWYFFIHILNMENRNRVIFLYHAFLVHAQCTCKLKMDDHWHLTRCQAITYAVSLLQIQVSLQIYHSLFTCTLYNKCWDWDQWPLSFYSYPHPYKYELSVLKPTDRQLQDTEPLVSYRLCSWMILDEALVSYDCSRYTGLSWTTCKF